MNNLRIWSILMKSSCKMKIHLQNRLLCWISMNISRLGSISTKISWKIIFVYSILTASWKIIDFCAISTKSSPLVFFGFKENFEVLKSSALINSIKMLMNNFRFPSISVKVQWKIANCLILTERLRKIARLWLIPTKVSWGIAGFWIEVYVTKIPSKIWQKKVVSFVQFQQKVPANSSLSFSSNKKFFKKKNENLRLISKKNFNWIHFLCD